MSEALTRRSCIVGAAATLVTAAKAAAPPTLLVAPADVTAHDPGPGWPDRPERLVAVLKTLEGDAFKGLACAEAPLAAREDVLRVHSASLVEMLERAAPAHGVAQLGPDLVLGADSFGAAMRAAGGAVFAIDAVMQGSAKSAFVAARPPGHHATRGKAMGFCCLNNAAIAARRAMTTHGAERVAIVDFDVHHGNGTQEIFWAEKNVLYCSTHQAPHYPGTGAVNEAGEFDNIVNAPLVKGDGGDVFRAALKDRVLPRLDAFRPDIVIVSAGFDAHLHDPLGGLRLVKNDFRDATRRIVEIAVRRCGGRIVSLLEGGYRPEELAASVAAHVGALMEA